MNWLYQKRVRNIFLFIDLIVTVRWEAYYSIITWCFSYWASYRSEACCIGLRRSTIFQVFQYFTVHRQYYFSSVPVLHCSQAVLFFKCSSTSLFTGSTICQVFLYFTVHRQYYFSSVPVLHCSQAVLFFKCSSTSLFTGSTLY
jgi:hypothetical protein